MMQALQLLHREAYGLYVRPGGRTWAVHQLILTCGSSQPSFGAPSSRRRSSSSPHIPYSLPRVSIHLTNTDPMVQLLNSAGFLLSIQAALVLQPTHTPEQKRSGTVAHLLFHVFGTSALTAGLVIIELNKAGPGHEHFASPHAILGLTFYILIYIQAIIGFTQYYTPSVYGGVDNAKSIYKYHRLSGYLIATLGLATICAASWTTYSLNVAHIQHWAVIVASVLVLAGTVPRIRLSKFGLKKDEGQIRLQS
jgi:hypothetical protein